MTTPNARRISNELDATGLEARADGDRIAITGSTIEIDRLLDRLQPARRSADCDGQLSLFDSAPYMLISLAPAPAADGQLTLTTSTNPPDAA